MTTPAVEADDGWWYGYGLELRERDGRREIRHGGSMPGFGATMLGDLDSGLGVAVGVNATDERDLTEEIAVAILDLYRDGTAPPRIPDPLAVEERRRLRGVYDGDDGPALAPRRRRPPPPGRRAARAARGAIASSPTAPTSPTSCSASAARTAGSSRRCTAATSIGARARRGPRGRLILRSGVATRATTAPTTPGTRTSASSCARASWCSSSPGAWSSRSTPLADGCFRAGDEWSPERLRFDAIAGGRGPQGDARRRGLLPSA